MTVRGDTSPEVTSGPLVVAAPSPVAHCAPAGFVGRSGMEFGAGVVFVGFSLEPVDPDSAQFKGGGRNDDTGGKENGAAVSDLAAMDGKELPLITRGDSATNPLLDPNPGTLSAGEDTSWIRPPSTPRADSPT